MGRNAYAAMRRENEELLYKLQEREQDHRHQQTVLQETNGTLRGTNATLLQKQEELLTTIESLQQRLQDQATTQEQETRRLQQDVTGERESVSQLRRSVGAMMPQLRDLLAAYGRDQERRRAGGQSAAATSITSAASGQPNTQLEQARDALKTHQDLSRRTLEQREAILTCPISLELFENPVTTDCCGKTFSAVALLQATSLSTRCPVCRAQYVSSHPSRDMAALVELHRSESAALGVSAPAASTPTTVADTTPPVSTQRSVVAVPAPPREPTRQQTSNAQSTPAPAQPTSNNSVPPPQASNATNRRGGRNRGQQRSNGRWGRRQRPPQANNYRAPPSPEPDYPGYYGYDASTGSY